MTTSNVLGVRVDDLSSEELCARVLELVRSGRKSVVANVNMYAINIAWEQHWFRNFLNGCDTVFCDGYGVVLAARILGGRVRYRLTYAELIWSIAELCEKNGLALFFLGAQPGVADQAAGRILARHPGIKRIGTCHGYFDQSPASPENRAVIEKINACRPDILVIGLGMPFQEKWIQENLEALDVKVFMPAGAVFDYTSGRIKRAPRWVTDHGLEWLGRLIVEPRRLWRRYLLGIPRYLLRIAAQKFGLTAAK